MAIEPVIRSALTLPIEERIRLVQDLWDSIAEIPDAVLVSEAQLAELKLRLDEYHADPTRVSPWKDVRNRIENSQ